MKKLLLTLPFLYLSACGTPDPLGEPNLLAFSSSANISDEKAQELVHRYSESFKCWTRDVGPYPDYDIISEEVSESGKSMVVLLSHPDYPGETALKIKVVPQLLMLAAYGPKSEGDFAMFLKKLHKEAAISTAVCEGSNGNTEQS